MFAAVRKTGAGFSVTGKFAGSNECAALLLEDPESPGSERHEVAFRVVDLRFGRRGAASAMKYLALAGYAAGVDRTEEMDVHLYGRGPHAHERQHREAHGVVYERSVDPAVQRARPVEVDLLNVDGYSRASRLDLFDLSPNMLGESDLLVEIPREMIQLLPIQHPRVVCHRTLLPTWSSGWVARSSHQSTIMGGA